MKVALMQINPLETKLTLPTNVDFIVYPEMMHCAYENEAIKKSTTSFHQDLQSLIDQSKQNKAYILATLAEVENDKVYNTCFVLHQGEILTKYRKCHLMEFHGQHIYTEKDVFTPGNELVTFDTPFGKMGILICFDIRFPEMARLLAQEGIQCLFVPAAFNTQVGQAHWQALLQARAIENQIFVIGVNPAHYTYQSYTSYGHSMVVDPFGTIQKQLDEDTQIEIVDIDINKIEHIRKRSPYWDIRRNDLYEVKKK